MGQAHVPRRAKAHLHKVYLVALGKAGGVEMYPSSKAHHSSVTGLTELPDDCIIYAFLRHF